MCVDGLVPCSKQDECLNELCIRDRPLFVDVLDFSVDVDELRGLLLNVRCDISSASSSVDAALPALMASRITSCMFCAIIWFSV